MHQKLTKCLFIKFNPWLSPQRFNVSSSQVRSGSLQCEQRWFIPEGVLWMWVEDVCTRRRCRSQAGSWLPIVVLAQYLPFHRWGALPWFSGETSVITNPPPTHAEKCFYLMTWRVWNCGRVMALTLAASLLVGLFIHCLLHRKTVFLINTHYKICITTLIMQPTLQDFGQSIDFTQPLFSLWTPPEMSKKR